MAIHSNIRKTACITGATSGIGAAFAKKFAEQGYNLIITGRRKEKIELLANSLSNNHKVNVYTTQSQFRRLLYNRRIHFPNHI